MSKRKREKQINIRIENELNEAFERVVDRKGYNKSLVIRELIKSYVEKNSDEKRS